MPQAFAITSLVVTLAGAAAFAYRSMRLRQLVRQRTFEQDEPAEAERSEARSSLRRYRAMPWLVGLSALAGTYLLGLPLVYAVALAVIVALLGGQLEEYWHGRRVALLERQLADAIDLMVGTLSAGAGATAAIETAAREIKRPLKHRFEEVLARIRLGDDPQAVFESFSRHVPLENYLLFSSTLAVHWEVGGSLAPTLATLGRTVRDRIEIARRIRSNIVQSQATTGLILAVTYFIALLMWRHDPGVVERFVASATGSWLIAGTMVLQSLGIAWMAAISKPRF